MRRVWTIGALAWTAVILAITLSPQQPTDGGFVHDWLAWWTARGLPAWVTYDTVEIAANVVLFIPFGFLLSRSLSERSETKGPTILWPTVLGLALSLAIEFSQAAFLPARFPTVSDLAANTGGALLGAVIAVSAHRFRDRRQLLARWAREPKGSTR